MMAILTAKSLEAVSPAGGCARSAWCVKQQAYIHQKVQINNLAILLSVIVANSLHACANTKQLL